MKKLFWVITIICSLVLAGACSSNIEAVKQPHMSEIYENYNEGIYEDITEYEIMESTTKSIHEEYDFLLSQGTSDNGDTYCLVANEYEDYSGTEITVGVIKNNEWLIEPTSDSPFVREDGLLVGGDSLSDFKEYEHRIEYMGNGCFGYNISYVGKVIVFNTNTNKSYVKDGYRYRLSDGCICDEGKFVLYKDSYYSHECLILDTNDMSVETYFSPISDTGPLTSHLTSFYMYSDGLIFIKRSGSQQEYGNPGFYDLNGNLVIDMNEYDMYDGYDHRNHYIFKNGTCDLYVYNDQHSVYKITIDKTGNVLSSTKVS